jgi:uncharacterized protein
MLVLLLAGALWLPPAAMTQTAAPAIDQLDADGLTPLMRAAALGDLARVNDLLAMGAGPDTRSTPFAVTALMCAAYYGHLPVVEALMAKGAGVRLQDGAGAGAIEWALIGNRKAVEDLLAKKGAALNPFLQVMNVALGLMETAGKKK